MRWLQACCPQHQPSQHCSWAALQGLGPVHSQALEVCQSTSCLAGPCFPAPLSAGSRPACKFRSVLPCPRSAGWQARPQSSPRCAAAGCCCRSAPAGSIARARHQGPGCSFSRAPGWRWSSGPELAKFRTRHCARQAGPSCCSAPSAPSQSVLAKATDSWAADVQARAGILLGRWWAARATRPRQGPNEPASAAAPASWRPLSPASVPKPTSMAINPSAQPVLHPQAAAPCSALSQRRTLTGAACSAWCAGGGHRGRAPAGREPPLVPTHALAPTSSVGTTAHARARQQGLCQSCSMLHGCWLGAGLFWPQMCAAGKDMVCNQSMLVLSPRLTLDELPACAWHLNKLCKAAPARSSALSPAGRPASWCGGMRRSLRSTGEDQLLELQAWTSQAKLGLLPHDCCPPWHVRRQPSCSRSLLLQPLCSMQQPQLGLQTPLARRQPPRQLEAGWMQQAGCPLRVRGAQCVRGRVPSTAVQGWCSSPKRWGRSQSGGLHRVLQKLLHGRRSSSSSSSSSSSRRRRRRFPRPRTGA